MAPDGALQPHTQNKPHMVKVEVGEKNKLGPTRDSVTVTRSSMAKRPPSQLPDTLLPAEKRMRTPEDTAVKLVDIVSKLKLTELKKELSERGLAKSGKKEILAARLLSHLEIEVRGQNQEALRQKPKQR